MRVNGLTKGFFILIVFIVTLAFFDVLSPYYSAILWAAILAVIFNPVKKQDPYPPRRAQWPRGADDHRHYLSYRFYAAGYHSLLAGLRAQPGVQQLQHNDTQFPTVVASLFAHLPAGPEASSPIITLIARSRSSSSSLMPL